MTDSTQSGTQTEMRGWPSEEVSDAAADNPSAAFGDMPMDDDGLPTREALRTALKAVMDPEIGINIVDLGLVYDVEKADGQVSVEMTLTSMGCPLTELIHQQCTLVLTRLPGVEHVDVNFVFSPPWSTDMISDEAKDELRAMGFNV
jgi:metal-sulfur cluster biosynthetic enzyme